MTRTPEPPPVQTLLTVRSPADLLAAVPYLLGFHPEDSIVVVAMRDCRVVFAARADLPPPGAVDADVAAAASYLAAVVARQGGDLATVIGYGAPARVEPVAPLVEAALAQCGLRVLDVLRAHASRYWSYTCADPGCCPPEGVSYDPTTSPIAAAATVAGQPVLSSRAAVADQVAPVTGADREAMRAAAERAEGRLSMLLDRTPVGDVLGGRAVRAAGEAAVADLLRCGAAGRRPGDDEVAWTTLLLTHLPVRDAAWRRLTDEDWQLALWSDVVRRAAPRLTAAPASLLAFLAWRNGHGALANVALDRALADDPDYSLARLLRDALDSGVAPSALDPWPPTADSGGARRARRPRGARPRLSRRGDGGGAADTRGGSDARRARPFRR